MCFDKDGSSTKKKRYFKERKTSCRKTPKLASFTSVYKGMNKGNTTKCEEEELHTSVLKKSDSASVGHQGRICWVRESINDHRVPSFESR